MGIPTGIVSNAQEGSSGQVGSIFINTHHLLSEGGRISISSKPDAETVSSASTTQTLTIEADTIRLNSGSLITASSDNAIPASAIEITATESLYLDHSQITTSATQSSGGNIELTPEILILDGGFIQANAGGVNANGGNVTVNTDTIIASQGNLQTGGTLVDFDPTSERNIIQATAEQGVSGQLDFPSPQLNISGSLLQLDNELIDLAALIENPCNKPGIRNSKLTRLGRGSLPESASAARSVPVNHIRLARLSAEAKISAEPEGAENTELLPSSLKLALVNDCHK